jgi:hypothetical protein
VKNRIRIKHELHHKWIVDSNCIVEWLSQRLGMIEYRINGSEYSSDNHSAYWPECRILYAEWLGVSLPNDVTRLKLMCGPGWRVVKSISKGHNYHIDVLIDDDVLAVQLKLILS